MNKIIYGANEVDLVAQKLKNELVGCKVVTFTGPLGAGKTTLIRALGKALGIKDEITSPTFAYMNMYGNEANERFVHFDLYRLNNIDEFIAAGFDEYLDEDMVFVEWPEIINPLLKLVPTCHVVIDYEGIDRRVLHINKELL
ncbi:MAG: tRNA (adenosine(37)-N6)-threonylcarbamoyltransferase complex ATPase subunit type 1 TsaE [Candidatus Dependentiae bacterium]